MITLDEFASLKLGDQIETVDVLPVFGPDVVTLTVTNVVEGVKLDFAASYHGVAFGAWACVKKADKLDWSIR